MSVQTHVGLGCAITAISYVARHPDRHERPSFGNIVQRLQEADEFLLTNRKEEKGIEGKLGDALDASENCYTDLQHIYAKY